MKKNNIQHPEYNREKVLFRGSDAVNIDFFGTIKVWRERAGDAWRTYQTPPKGAFFGKTDKETLSKFNAWIEYLKIVAAGRISYALAPCDEYVIEERLDGELLLRTTQTAHIWVIKREFTPIGYEGGKIIYSATETKAQQPLIKRTTGGYEDITIDGRFFAHCPIRSVHIKPEKIDKQNFIEYRWRYGSSGGTFDGKPNGSIKCRYDGTLRGYQATRYTQITAHFEGGKCLTGAEYEPINERERLSQAKMQLDELLALAEAKAVVAVKTDATGLVECLTLSY